MNNNVGKEIVLDGIHLGKVIAGPTEDPCKGFYLVLLSEEGKRYEEGWALNITDDEKLKKLCGKYGNNPKNRFYFFSKHWSFRFFEGAAKVLTNE